MHNLRFMKNKNHKKYEHISQKQEKISINNRSLLLVNQKMFGFLKYPLVNYYCIYFAFLCLSIQIHIFISRTVRYDR